jgi:hypothetical protein
MHKDSPSIKRILAQLQEHGPMTADQIAEKAFVAYDSFVGKYRAVLLGAGRIHVADKKTNPRGGWPKPIYAYGPGKEAKNPPKVSKTESNKRWLAKRAIPKHDRVLNALMGRAA